MIRYADIVPDAIQVELISLRDSMTRCGWRVGDLTNAIVDHCDVNKIMVSKMDVYQAVGVFAGKAGRTVRDYAMLSAFYSPATRLEYDILSIDHFRTALRLGEAWQTGLEWCADQVATLGRPAGVDAMEARFMQKR